MGSGIGKLPEFEAVQTIGCPVSKTHGFSPMASQLLPAYLFHSILFTDWLPLLSFTPYNFSLHIAHHSPTLLQEIFLSLFLKKFSSYS